MQEKIKVLYDEWQRGGGLRTRDRLVATALGGEVVEAGGAPRVRWHHEGLVPEEELPTYTTNLNDAARAMDQAWEGVEEAAPVRILCQRDPNHPRQRGDCLVEWWPDEENHVATPRFASEAEGRAFAAFAFARLKRQA
ncbi:MAG: hypothetical protein COW73_03155 [Nitrospirae bacterium CG18_big_fil_WC_8_21_14_2_50_70_55]|nr:hypothetical protein [Deltaproteobacteria bacterium]OIP64642.1 MAG: hypothetical protein AUK30_06305 [Nitrospirae bacterium CG2_30_70_394]PIQ06563.1 MAG: hypothetical protein COW73_03155 [Nitrospirae bacterium CG18_big_fil_WC_8_21_14_2_50_70_55]PIU79360.1 MAG: hypothetical protein COS73_04265 [Nitrospirae bacterium CG06_land_8_20_14_3_00_70_43]PIW83745.1 MAG: hypothetical protein COZ96_01640 [Nitrospirae bacterium CG_4_8_14_3_um_filter_70_85]PIX83528.1 MAG: hypothetical protein COZ33_04905 